MKKNKRKVIKIILGLLIISLVTFNLFFYDVIKIESNYKKYSKFDLPKREVDTLVLVNYENKLTKGFYIDLVEFDGYQVSRVLVDDLNNMYDQALKDGVKIYINNAYRSVESQEKIFNSRVNKYMKNKMSKRDAVALTKKSVQVPGYSEHHTGLAIDFSKLGDYQVNSKMWKWLSENASDYGFILRYPSSKTNITKISYEPWHYRYVGKKIAKEIKSKNITLEEYLKKGA